MAVLGIAGVGLGWALLCAANRTIKWPCSSHWNSGVPRLDGPYGLNGGHSSEGSWGEASWAPTELLLWVSPGPRSSVLLALRSGLTSVRPEVPIGSCSFASVANHGCSNSWMEERKNNNNAGAVKLKINLWDASMQSVLSSCRQGCLSQITPQTDADTVWKWDLPTLFIFSSSFAGKDGTSLEDRLPWPALLIAESMGKWNAFSVVL